MSKTTPKTQWGQFDNSNKYVVGLNHEVCPKCGREDVLSFGVPINDNTDAVYPFHWCACGHKWMIETEE